MTHILDKEQLILALQGQYRGKDVKTAYVQEISSEVSDKLLSVEGFEPCSLPIPRQVPYNITYI